MSEKDNSVGVFLSQYAATLLECGATTIRIEKNVLRMAEAYGCTARVNMYPLHIELVLEDIDTGRTTTVSKPVHNSAPNYHTITELSKLSWNCYDRRIPLDEAIALYKHVVATPRIPFAVVTTLTALANASFCRLFNGDWIAMLIVAIATAAGFYVKRELIRTWHISALPAIIISACLSAVLSCSCYVFNLGSTPDIALATSVLYLVPGIPYLNSISDLINGHYICATSRLIYSCMITICLAVGLYIGLLLMNAHMM